MSTDETYLTREQVAARLKITTKTLANWAWDGKGPPFMRLGLVGAPVRYPCESYFEWERSQTELFLPT
ncbi:helix-turn-helix domain-containing protein [Nocardia sp. NBC_01327]|uniref:helix-turn-helix domain-containing protein n=1 Tax=Nocardia sp. NBC_01327 TaxID=2903593 RepID=UPI002E151F7B|nr:helix-turn-helix domain-containing protein [Nocardia sp. NBC_01327]